MATEQRIPVILAETGMELSRPVSDGSINICAAGTVLNDRLIAQLNVRGIERIWVSGMPLPVRSQLPVNQQISQLRNRFSNISKRPTMAIIERHIEEIIKQERV